MESLCKRSTSCQLWEVLAKCFDNKGSENGWLHRYAVCIVGVFGVQYVYRHSKTFIHVSMFITTHPPLVLFWHLLHWLKNREM